MIFLNKESKSNKKKTILAGGRGWRCGSRVSDFFFFSTEFFLVCVCVCVWGGGGGGVDRRTEEQAQTNLPLQLL